MIKKVNLERLLRSFKSDEEKFRVISRLAGRIEIPFNMLEKTKEYYEKKCFFGIAGELTYQLAELAKNSGIKEKAKQLYLEADRLQFKAIEDYKTHFIIKYK